MKNIFNILNKHKHRLTTVALVFGFIVDVVTFRTLNLTYSQIILGVHIFIVAFSIILLAIPLKEGTGVLFKRARAWIPIAQQYSTGNLLSAFLVLYSGSGSLTQSWLFLGLLAIAAIGNETIKLQKYKLPFDTTLLFVNILLFSVLAVPVAVGSITVATFLISLLVGALLFQLFRFGLRLVAKETFMRNRKNIRKGAFGVFVLVIVFYFMNIIPPLPLSVKHIGFYHDVSRVGGEYVVRTEPHSFFDSFFDLAGQTIHVVQGENVYVFSAVFAPAKLDTQIVHRWEYFDEKSEAWVIKNKVPFPITGGREGGYRGFSLTENPSSGRWRVSVETTRGQVISRANLVIKRVSTPVSTISEKF